METIGMHGGSQIKGLRAPTSGSTPGTGNDGTKNDPWYSGENAAGWGAGLGSVLDAILNRGGSGSNPTPGGYNGQPAPQQNNTLMYAIVALVVVVVLVLIVFMLKGKK